MSPRRALLLVASHLAAGLAGFALRIDLLPILIAPKAPTAGEVAAAGAAPPGEILFAGEFRRDPKDSDLLHWGEGRVTVGRTRIALAGRLAPGLDDRRYLPPGFVDTEADVARLKQKMARVEGGEDVGELHRAGAGVDRFRVPCRGDRVARDLLAARHGGEVPLNRDGVRRPPAA